MTRLTEKSSRAPASRGGGTIPDFPKFNPRLANVPGAQETNAEIQRWNSQMKRRWVLLDEDLTKRFRIDAGFNDGLISLQASLTEEQLVRANADNALASDLLSLTASFTSAVLSLSSDITTEQTVRAAADSTLATSITTLSSTLSTAVTTLSADIATEATTRASADTAMASNITTLTASVGTLSSTVSTFSSAIADLNGYLEGRWTVQVSAGPIVTGMTLFSSTGADTDVSYIAFQADRFQINTASGGNKQLFSATATAVKLGNVLTVDLSGAKIYMGTGIWADPSTPFFVDSAGNFSLANKLYWNGTLLVVSGSVTATSGTIGGWGITSTTITQNNATLDSAGQLVLGTSNDVIYISATDATYRVWIGNASSGSAAFKVTKGGVMTANGATIAGTFVASDDANYPTWQGGTLATRGVFNQRGGGTAPAYASLGFHTSNLIEGNVSGGNYGALSAVTATDVGVLLNSKYYNGSSWVSGSSLEIRNDASVSGTAAASSYLQFLLRNTTSTSSIWRWTSAGVLEIGDAFGRDTNLYRSAANTLKTDDAFIAVGSITGASFAGSGASLTSLNASNISSGTISNAYLPSAISVSTLALSSSLTINGSSSPFDMTNGTVTFRQILNGGTSRVNWGTTSNHTIEVFTNNTSRWLFSTDGNLKANGAYGIHNLSGSGWTVPFNDGSANIELRANGGTIEGRINGGAAITLG